ncbi:MAG: DUF4330 domain-containing protein [Oscillospiraceae bacterium]|nr:DUF4330 domain-containing protein [Oscillospiraceae bacterium]
MRKLIDEKGRIGGKFSVIDLGVLALILVILLGGAFTFLRSEQETSGSETPTGRNIPVRYMMEIAGVRDWTVRNIELGDTLFLGEFEVGTIIGVETEPHRQLVTGDGAVWWGEVPNRYLVTLEIESTATVLEGRILIARSVPMSVGNSTGAFHTRYTAFHATVREFIFDEES